MGKQAQYMANAQLKKRQSTFSDGVHKEPKPETQRVYSVVKNMKGTC